MPWINSSTQASSRWKSSLSSLTLFFLPSAKGQSPALALPSGRRPVAEPVAEIVVFVTTSSEEEAMRIGLALVQAELASCVNVLPQVRSIFRWEGKVTEEQEFMMVIKSRSDLFEVLAVTVKRLHSYAVPEIIALPIVKGSEEYLAWIRDSTRKPKE